MIKYFPSPKIQIGIVCILNIIARLNGINRALWQDELISLSTSQNNIFLNPFYFGYTTNLPLFFYILNIWQFVAQGNLVILRLLPILISTLNIYIIYKFLKAEISTGFAIFFAAIFIFAPIQVHYAQEIRPYILVQLLLSLHLIHLYYFIKNKLPLNYYIYLATGTLLLFTHYAAFFFIFIEFIVLLGFTIYTKNYKDIIKMTASYIMMGIAGLLVFFIVKLNPEFKNSLQEQPLVAQVGLHNFKDLPKIVLTEGATRIKEVVSFYYWYGIWYYQVAPIVQFFFKKIALLIFIMFPIIFMLKKRVNKIEKKDIIAFFSGIMLILILLTTFILEKFGIYPFGGRHIMPFSILLILIITYVISYIDRYFKLIRLMLIALIALWVFHQSCSNYIQTLSVKVQDANVYSYCIKRA